jgi:tellurite resistance protein TehA-like permease
MTEFEKNFEIFRLWTLLGVIAGFVGLGLLIYGFSKRRNTLKALGLTLFGHMFLCGLIFSLLTNYFLRRASSELLQILNDPKVTLSLCDRTVSEDIQAHLFLK